MAFFENIFRRLPYEVIDKIADYHDYEKYSKPQHKKLFKNVLISILEMSDVFYGDNNLSPRIAFQCWGNGWPREWELDSEDGFYNYDGD